MIQIRTRNLPLYLLTLPAAPERAKWNQLNKTEKGHYKDATDQV